MPGYNQLWLTSLYMSPGKILIHQCAGERGSWGGGAINDWDWDTTTTRL